MRASRREALVAAMRALQPVALVAVPAAMAAWAWLRLPQAALSTSALAGLALLPFFVSLEAQRRRARDLMPIVVIVSLAVAGRLVFAPVPSVKPVTALVIIGGICFGREEGFVIGALTMLVSNVFFGQGPWTPWQMFSMGLVGYLSGAVGGRGHLRGRWRVAAFGFAMVFLYGFILDTWTLIGFVPEMTPASVTSTYLAGFFTNLASALATVGFLAPIAESWPRMFGRICEKYEIGSARAGTGRTLGCERPAREA